MEVRRTAWTWAAFLALGLLLAGCGDSNVFDGVSNDSSPQAKQQDGLDALNGGNYAQAAKIFEDLWATDPSPQVATYLASAYMGQSGFDTLSLIDEIAQAQERSGSATTPSVIYDATTKLFDANGDGVISKAELDEKSALVAKAVGVLVDGYPPAAGLLRSASDATPSQVSDDQLFQAGLYAAVHAVLGVVEQLQYPAGSGNYLLTIDVLRQTLGDIIETIGAPQGFDDDLALVRQARDVLIAASTAGTGTANDNDIAAEFDKFLTNIGYLPDLHVTDPELRAYLTSLVQ